MGSLTIRIDREPDEIDRVMTETDFDSITNADFADICSAAAAAGLALVYKDMLEKGLEDSPQARMEALKCLVPNVFANFMLQIDMSLGAGQTTH